jgi:hypothetical protein
MQLLRLAILSLSPVLSPYDAGMQSSLVSAKPAYRHVGENLYRRVSSGIYYALLKKGGKQFRRALKTNDIALARRRLNELREDMRFAG